MGWILRRVRDKIGGTDTGINTAWKDNKEHAREVLPVFLLARIIQFAHLLFRASVHLLAHYPEYRGGGGVARNRNNRAIVRFRVFIHRRRRRRASTAARFTGHRDFWQSRATPLRMKTRQDVYNGHALTLITIILPQFALTPAGEKEKKTARRTRKKKPATMKSGASKLTRRFRPIRNYSQRNLCKGDIFRNYGNLWKFVFGSAATSRGVKDQSRKLKRINLTTVFSTVQNLQ